MESMDRRQFGIHVIAAGCTGAGAVRSFAGSSVKQEPKAQPPNSLAPYPIAVAVNGKGTIFVTDKNLKRVYRIEGGKPEAIFKGSPKYRTPLYNVMAMAADSAGNLYFADTGSMDVWRMAPDGTLSPLTAVKIARGNGPAPANQDFDIEAAYAGDFEMPMGVTVDAENNPIVADLKMKAIFRVAAGKLVEIAHVEAPHGIAPDKDGGFVVVSQSKDQLVRVSAKGEVTPIVKGPLAPKNNPHQVVVDSAGYIVSDNYAGAIWRVTPDGHVKPIAQGVPLQKPVGLALEPDGNILVADPHAKKLFRVSVDGKVNEVVAFPPLAS